MVGADAGYHEIATQANDDAGKAKEPDSMTPLNPPLPGQPMMPMGAAAAKFSTPANLTPPMPPHGPAPAQPMPQGPMSPPMPSSPLPSLPAPSAPQQPPYKVRPQPDGTLAVVWPLPDGSETIGQILPAPKTPPAFQPPRQ